MRTWLAVAAMGLGVGVLWSAAAPGGGPTDADLVKAFREECAAKAAAADKAETMTVVGKDGWLFFARELRHISVGPFWGEAAAKVSRADKPESADPLPAILDFKAQCDKAGIELVLVPVPPKAIVYPDMLGDAVKAGPDGPPRLDTAHQEFYALLRQKGLTVLDLTADFIAHRNDKEGAIFCKQDTHWSDLACILAAKKIAEVLKDRPWLKDRPKLTLTSERREIELRGDLWAAMTGAKPPAEKINVRLVGAKGDAGLAPVEPDRASPIVLLGDSHNLVFHSGDDMQCREAGLADQLALETGLAVDLIGVRGSGATPARVNLLRRARADPEYLGKKKVIVWCFAAREFTESAGWQKVAIVK
jgi:alginate O-acetyltransferase complex protein AlgJ